MVTSISIPPPRSSTAPRPLDLGRRRARRSSVQRVQREQWVPPVQQAFKDRLAHKVQSDQWAPWDQLARRVLWAQPELQDRLATRAQPDQLAQPAQPAQSAQSAQRARRVRQVRPAHRVHREQLGQLGLSVPLVRQEQQALKVRPDCLALRPFRHP